MSGIGIFTKNRQNRMQSAVTLFSVNPLFAADNLIDCLL